MTMRTGTVVGVGVAVLLAAEPARTLQAQGADPLLVDNLLSIGSVVSGRDAPQWSPDGSAILFLSSLGGGSGLWSISPEGGFPVQMVEDLSLVGVGSLGSPAPTPSPNGEWVSYVSSKSGAPEIWLWSASDGRDVRLTDLGARVGAFSWSPDGRWIAFSGDRYGDMDVWKVSVPDGDIHRLTSDDRYEVFPTWTPDGQSILYVRLDERWVDHHVMEIPAEGGESRLVVEDKDFFDYRGGTAFGAAQVSPDGDGGTVLFRSLRSGWHNYWVVPRSGGEPRPIAPEEADQTEAKWSPDGQQILYISNHNGTHKLRVVSASGGEPQVLVAPQEMGVIDKPEWSPDGARISYTLETPTRPEDLYVVSVQGGEQKQLTQSMPAGQLEEQLVVPEKITYPSTDGLTISAYLYKPALAQPGERFPGILWIHGGPTSQFNDTFQPEVQFFVQRGYMVLLPNIRGSSGYGKAFEDANNPCWGHCDLEDVRAGVEYLKTLSYVDAEKMGITGTSYGGIMSMAAVSFAPGLFQAAIPISGYGDWVKFHEWNNELQHTQLLAYEFGPFPENEEVYRRNSPIYAVQHATTPTFVLHGDQQEIAWRPGQLPIPASLDFARALDQHYKIYRYKSYPSGSYYISGRQSTRQKLLDMLEFFDQFLKGSVAGP